MLCCCLVALNSILQLHVPACCRHHFGCTSMLQAYPCRGTRHFDSWRSRLSWGALDVGVVSTWPAGHPEPARSHFHQQCQNGPNAASDLRRDVTEAVGIKPSRQGEGDTVHHVVSIPNRAFLCGRSTFSTLSESAATTRILPHNLFAKKTGGREQTRGVRL